MRRKTTATRGACGQVRGTRHCGDVGAPTEGAGRGLPAVRRRHGKGTVDARTTASGKGARHAAHRPGLRGSPVGAARPRARLSGPRPQYANAVTRGAATTAAGHTSALELVWGRVRP